MYRWIFTGMVRWICWGYLAGSVRIELYKQIEAEEQFPQIIR